MARLFVSLYLFIAVILIAISALLDQVLFDEGSTLPAPVKLGSTLLQAAQTTPQIIGQVAENAGFSVKTVSLHDFNWLDEDIEQLQQGGVITLFDPKLGYQFYLLQSEQVLLELSDPDYRPPPPFVLYSALFFVLMGVLLAIWVWPLWRDLHRLQQAAENKSADAVMPKVELSTASLIKPIADAFNAMSQRVTVLMQTQRELTGAVAHELRTPLSRLKFALAIKPVPGSSPWQAMNHDVDELETLVEEMLDYTSMESQQPELSMSTIPLDELCNAVVERLPPDLRRDLDVTVQPLNVYISADAHFVERAVQNLLINACRYAQNRIQVSIARRESGVEVSVADDGRGVEKALQEKIFEPFYRPDEGRNRRRGGAGLGLAIVKRIMQWHHGQCWVCDGQDGGACFVMRFPEEVTANGDKPG